MLDPSRLAFFHESLKTLNLAALDGFDSLKEAAERELNAYKQFKLSRDLSLASRITYYCHSYSQGIYPDDGDEGLTPVVVRGDGNCLYRSMSLLLCGKEDLHTELRSRVVCEMVLGNEFYTSGAAVSCEQVAAKEIVKKIAAVSASFQQGQSLEDDDTVSKIFQDECIATTKSGTYSSMWHLQALASAVVCNIHSVYPNVAPGIRSVLNTVACPRIADFSELVGYTIMWTRTVPMPQSHSLWIPNHFVPCVSSSAVSHVGRVLKRSLPNPMKIVPLSKHPKESVTNSQAKAVKQPLVTTLFSKKQLCSPDNTTVADTAVKQKVEACDDEQQPPEKKRRSVKYDTFKRWQSEFDPELTWLDSDCVATVESRNQIVKQLKCQICTKYQNRITGIRNFSNKWIVGADCLRTSNIRDHSKSDQHIAAMNLHRRDFGKDQGISVVEFAPIAKNLHTLPEDERKKVEIKFDIAYFIATEPWLSPSTLRYAH